MTVDDEPSTAETAVEPTPWSLGCAVGAIAALLLMAATVMVGVGSGWVYTGPPCPGC